jgi:hypothetical protein
MYSNLIFRQVDTETGRLMIGRHTGAIKEGAVYSGGGNILHARLTIKIYTQDDEPQQTVATHTFLK